MLGVGFSEILIIALVSFIALGPKQIPGLMRKLAGLYRQWINLRDEFRMQVLSLEEEEKKKPDQVINIFDGNKHG
jgi:Sec-independent protein translocase protein TatA